VETGNGSPETSEDDIVLDLPLSFLTDRWEIVKALLRLVLRHCRFAWNPYVYFFCGRNGTASPASRVFLLCLFLLYCGKVALTSMPLNL